MRGRHDSGPSGALVFGSASPDMGSALRPVGKWNRRDRGGERSAVRPAENRVGAGHVSGVIDERGPWDGGDGYGRRLDRQGVVASGEG